MKLKLIGSIVAISLLGGFVVACEDDEPSAEEATAQLCTDLGSLQTALNDMRSISAESTVDEFRAARDDVQSALDDVRSSAEDVENAEIEAVEDAYSELESVGSDLDGDQSVAAAFEDITTQLQAVDDAWGELFQGLRCQERTPTGGTVTAVSGTVTAVSGTVVTGATGTAEANATSTADAEATPSPDSSAETGTPEAVATEPSPAGTAAATATP